MTNYWDAFRSSLSSCKPLTEREEAVLSVRWRRYKDVAARNRLIESVLPWAVHQAKRYIHNRIVDPDEVIALAIEGVVDALTARTHFDARRGRLTTYATHHIRRRVLLTLRTQSTCIRIPSTVHDNQLENVARVHAMCSTEIVPGGFKRTLGSTIEDKHTEQPLDLLVEQEDQEIQAAQKQQMYNAILRLPENRKEIMLLRLRGQTLEQIGNLVGLTRERVRQLEMSATEMLFADLCPDRTPPQPVSNEERKCIVTQYLKQYGPCSLADLQRATGLRYSTVQRIARRHPRIHQTAEGWVYDSHVAGRVDSQGLPAGGQPAVLPSAGPGSHGRRPRGRPPRDPVCSGCS